MTITRRFKAAALLLGMAALGVTIRSLATPEYQRSHYSPRHVYRLDYYEVSWLQRMAHWDMRHPHVIRLYRIEPPALLGESAVVDLWINGQLYWYLYPPMNKVRIGRDVVFENIPPECAGCPPLPDSAAMP
ncbi:hypothetical protein [Paracidovorax avenae]|uniref:hypothetical protein n=1 Tax=Paracidovorax avenae TaxID=80867 RepID=UPI0006B32BFA|nr:hypothetical protein [Paracidovorax avenae]